MIRNVFNDLYECKSIHLFTNRLPFKKSDLAAAAAAATAATTTALSNDSGLNEQCVSLEMVRKKKKKSKKKSVR